MIDTHCHLDAGEFAHDRLAVLGRARASRVNAQILPAVAHGNWAALRELGRCHADLFPAYGLHPIYLAEHAPEHLALLREWIFRERPVAVGEIGLDHFLPGLDAQAQATFFTEQLAIARDFDLPVIVHARRAHDEVISALRKIGGLRGVVHSFAGSEQQADQLFRLGFCLGIGGPVTYPRAQRLRRIVAAMPNEYLLLETDSPDQPLCSHRGARNEPGYLGEILNCVAELRREPAGRLESSTDSNAVRLFGLPI